MRASETSDVARGDDDVEVAAIHQRVEALIDLVALGHGERAAGREEVDDDQRPGRQPSLRVRAQSSSVPILACATIHPMPESLEDLSLSEIVRPPAEAVVWVEPARRRVRAMLGGQAVADSSDTLLLFERDHLPVYYFPLGDVRQDLLEPSKRTSTCPRKGEATYHSVRVGDRLARDAVWRYPEPIAGCPDISGHVAFYWNAMDSWWEEDDEVFVHARDPYKRVDVLRSSRHVRVELDGHTVAESARPLLLLETGLPERWYLPRADVRQELLRPSDKVTACPYKGRATYVSVDTGEALHTDIAWTYLAPIPECPKIEQAICFFNERVDLFVDGEQQPRPTTKWSERPA
jgi:uncharacterized protein (DUF427 family)